MREIKFRAWNKEKKEMIPLQKMSFKTGKCMPYGWNMSYKFNDVMQYTGLKDKNGIEIYEGDIVKSCEGRLYQVIWEDNGFKFLYKFNIRGYDEKTILELGDTSSRRWGVEVIGNIYQNNDLLKGDK